MRHRRRLLPQLALTKPVTHPFRGLLPLQRFASHKEPPTPRKLPTHRLRCVLGVSHPFDALLPLWPAGLVSSQFHSWGFTLRGFFPLETPYALSSAVTLTRLDASANASIAAPGLCSFQGSRTWVLGFSQAPSQMPPWVCASPRFLVRHGRCDPMIRTQRPSRTLSTWPHADLVDGAPGYTRTERNRSLSRPI